MLNVLFITHSYARNMSGGAAVYVMETTKHLSNMCNLKILTFESYAIPKNPFQKYYFNKGIENTEYIKTPIKTPLFISDILSFYYYSNKIGSQKFNEYNLCCFNDNSLGLINTKNIKIPKVLVMFHLHKLEFSVNPLGKILGKIYISIEKNAVRKADHIICASNTVKTEIMEKYTISEGNISVVPYGVNANLFKFNPIKKENTLLCVATALDKRKGLDYLITALSKLKEKGMELKLTIVGSGPLKMKNNLIKLAQRLDVATNVKIIPYASPPEISKLCQTSSILVIPSIVEGFGIPALEALSCGTPVIGTDTGAIPEIIENGKNGFVVSPKNSNTLANAIETLILDEKLRKKMGRNGRKKIEKYYSWKKTADKMLSVFKDVYVKYH